MELILVFRLGISSQPVIEFVGPQNRKMLVHQMPADTDRHGTHKHFQLVPGPDQIRHIRHNRIGYTVPVYVLIRKEAHQLDPIAGSVLVLHGYNGLIPIPVILQYGCDLVGQQFPAFRIIPIELVWVVMEQRFIPCL